MAGASIRVSKHVATGSALWPAKLPSQASSSKTYNAYKAQWPIEEWDKRHKQAKLDALCQSRLSFLFFFGWESYALHSRHCTVICPARPPRSIHQSMQHTTGIGINAGLSLPSHMAFVVVRAAHRAAYSFERGRPSTIRLWFLSLHVHVCVVNSFRTQKATTKSSASWSCVGSTNAEGIVHSGELSKPPSSLLLYAGSME